MARASVKIAGCDRCVTPTEATITEKVTWHGQVYEIDLCEKHAEMMQRDVWGWLRNAREVETSSVFEKTWSPFERRSSARAFSPPALVQGNNELGAAKDRPLTTRPPLPAIAQAWTFTKHAEQRLAERGPQYGFSRYEVLMAVVEPELVVPSTKQDETEIRKRGNLRVVVNPSSFLILTVSVREEADADTVQAEAGQRSAG